MRIEGKVAGVVSETMVAINVGKRQGVKVGDTVRVYLHVEVTDPDSKEDLGSVRLTKITLSVNYVDDRFSVAETVGTVPSALGSLYIGTFGAPQQLHVTVNPRAASSGTILVAVGDPVYVERDDKTSDAGTVKSSETRPDKPKAEPKPPAS